MVGHPEEQRGARSSAASATAVGVEGRQQHRRAAGRHGAVGARRTGRGRGRRAGRGPAGPRASTARPAHRLAAGQQVGVAEHRPLGRPGGPRGEADQRRVVRVGGVERRPGRRRAGPGPAPHTTTGPATAGTDPLGLLGPVHHGARGPDVGGDVGELALRRRCWPAPPPGRPAGRRRGPPGRRPRSRSTTPPGRRGRGRRPAADRRPAGGLVELAGRPPPVPLPPQSGRRVGRPPVGPATEQRPGRRRPGAPGRPSPTRGSSASSWSRQGARWSPRPVEGFGPPASVPAPVGRPRP